MNRPLPLRNPLGEFPAFTYFDREERQAKGAYTWPSDRLSCNPPHTLKRKLSQGSSDIKIPNLMTKIRRRLFVGGFSILSEDESDHSDSASEYSIASPSSPTPWNVQWQEWSPTDNHIQQIDIFLAELDFRYAAQEQFSSLDVEGLIADPGHDIISYEIFRGDPEPYDERLPHLPMRDCYCHACATYDTYREDIHDPSFWCNCYDCDHFWFMELYRREKQTEAEKWTEGRQQQQVLVAEKLDGGNDTMDMLDYWPEE